MRSRRDYWPSGHENQDGGDQEGEEPFTYASGIEGFGEAYTEARKIAQAEAREELAQREARVER